MAQATPTTHDAIIKHLYPFKDVLTVMYEDKPLLGMLKKNFEGYGKSWHLPFRIAHTAGRSRTYTNAKANKGPTKVVEMQITLSKDYSLYSVDGMLQRQLGNDKGGFVQAFQFELDGALDAMRRNMAISIYRNHGGARGQVASGQGTATVTLLEVNDIVNFEIGDVLVAASTDGTSGSPKAGSVTVKSIDRDAGTITVEQPAWNDASGIPSIAANDYLFKDGDFGQSVRGLDSWIPKLAPTPGDSFFGLDRSIDVVRLAGSRVDGSDLSIEEALQKACQRVHRNGGKITHFFMNDANFLDLILSLGSRKQYADTKTDVGVGYSGVRIHTGFGEVEVYADSDCPFNVCYGLTLKDWELTGPGEFPFIEARDGGRLVREDTADSFEGQVKAYYQMVCRAPHRQVRLQLG
jgi:hypothetical protein